MNAISENIKFYRSKNSLTQAQLADKLNVSEQEVYNWERGTRTPRMGYIEKMAKLFNVESPDILKVNKKPTNMKSLSQSGMQTENTNPDPADEIRKFKKLADEGIITQDEFETKKRQLLGL